MAYMTQHALCKWKYGTSAFLCLLDGEQLFYQQQDTLHKYYYILTIPAAYKYSSLQLVSCYSVCYLTVIFSEALIVNYCVYTSGIVCSESVH